MKAEIFKLSEGLEQEKGRGLMLKHNPVLFCAFWGLGCDVPHSRSPETVKGEHLGCPITEKHQRLVALESPQPHTLSILPLSISPHTDFPEKN
jgi:hypothetical protein